MPTVLVARETLHVFVGFDVDTSLRSPACAWRSDE